MGKQLLKQSNIESRKHGLKNKVAQRPVRRWATLLLINLKHHV